MRVFVFLHLLINVLYNQKMYKVVSRTIFLFIAIALANMFFVYSAGATEKKLSVKPQKNEATSTEVVKKNYTKTEARIISLVNERADILRNRWNALDDRLEIISGRISSLLDKMSAQGTDTTTAEMLLQSANERLSSARTRASFSYEAIKTRAEQTDGTATDLYKIEKNVIAPEKEAVAKSFQDAKDALADVLASIPKNK